MPTAMITGASKGIGLEFCRQYLKLGWDVIACHRGNVPEPIEMLRSQHTQVRPLSFDLENLDEIGSAVEQLSGQPIDLLINNAGRMGGPGGPDAQAGERFGSLDYDLFQLYMNANVRAPVKLIEMLVNNVTRSDTRKIVTISSGAGSFGMPATLPGVYWYKTSKAAVNMAMRNIAHDLRSVGVCVLMFHPGLVLTERLAPMREKLISMSGQERPFEPREAVSNMIAVIERATLEDSGRFLRNDGSDMPW